MLFRDLIEENTSSIEEAEKFAEFLWWENFKEVYLSGDSALQRWNAKMGHLLMIRGEGSPVEDIPKMIEIWRKHATNRL